MTLPTIDTAMILSAGLGTRMAPLTDAMPKPLIPVLGKPLIDWAVDRLQAAGIRRYVVNTHYLPDQIRDHFAGRADITLSHEEVLQESGGGVRDALPHLPESAFIVCNADAIWLDGVTETVARLRRAWDPARMDALLLMVNGAAAHGYDGPGDYYLEEDGTAAHRRDRPTAPFVFGGLQILSPALFDGAPDGPFRLTELYDRAEAEGRLFGIAHEGEWYHVGTPDALVSVEEIISHGFNEANTR